MTRMMKDSRVEWIGAVPSDWEISRLQYALLEISVKNDPIQTEDILSLTKDRGVIPYEDKGNQGNKSKTTLTDYKLAYPNTIVMNSMNVIIGSVGLSEYFGCVSPVYYVFKAKDNHEIRFFDYIFQTPIFQNELKKYANGILEIRLRVSSENVLKRRVALPNYEEQKRIADYLDKKCKEIEGVRESIEAEIKTLEEYKKSMITEAVTKGLYKSTEMKDSGIEWIGAVPRHWKVSKVKHNLSRTEERNPGNQQILSVYREYGVIPKDSRDDNYNVTSLDTSNYKYVKPGYLVINKMKAWQGSMGISDYTGVVSPAYYIYKLDYEKIYPLYLHNLFRTVYIDEFRRISGGIREGQWDLSAYLFENTYMPVPPINEQKAIADYLDHKTNLINEAIDGKKAQLLSLDEYKKSLIYEYVTGKKEVPHEDAL